VPHSFFFILSALGPKNIFPKKLGDAEIPFSPISTCHVIMGNKDYIIGMLHLIWHIINKDGKQMLIPCQAGYEDETPICCIKGMPNNNPPFEELLSIFSTFKVHY
jgi:hypothetical protein